MNCKMSFYFAENKAYRILNYNSFNDRLRPVFKINPTQNAKKKHIIKVNLILNLLK